MPTQTPSATAPRGTGPLKPKSTVSYTPFPQQDMIIGEQKRILDEALHHLVAATQGLQGFPLPPFAPQSAPTSPSSTDSWNHYDTDPSEDDMSDTDTLPGNKVEPRVGIRQLTRWLNHHKAYKPDFYYNAIIHHIESQDIQLSLVYGIAASSNGLPDEEKWPPNWNKLYPVMQWITDHLVTAVQSVPKGQREAFVKKGEQKMLEDGIVRDDFDGDGSKGKSVEVIEQHQPLRQILDPEFSTQRPWRPVRETTPEHTPTQPSHPESGTQTKDHPLPKIDLDMINAKFRQLHHRLRQTEERLAKEYGMKVSWGAKGDLIYEPIDEAKGRSYKEIAEGLGLALSYGWKDGFLGPILERK